VRDRAKNKDSCVRSQRKDSRSKRPDLGVLASERHDCKFAATDSLKNPNASTIVNINRLWVERFMNAKDILSLIHPAIAVAFVFPIVGIVVNFALQTRQRRLHPNESKKIPPVVGREHLKYGRWLTGSVVGVTLIALAYSIFIKQPFFTGKPPFQMGFIIAMFVFTIAALVLLYRTRPNQPLWRAVFATLSSAGLIVLGCQDGVFRRTSEWYLSHYYFGIVVSILMVVSLTIVPEIYKHQRWRVTHTVLNTLAALLFLGQAMTGARDLLEIPLSWQAPFLYQCDWQNRVCPEPQSSQPVEGHVAKAPRF